MSMRNRLGSRSNLPFRKAYLALPRVHQSSTMMALALLHMLFCCELDTQLCTTAIRNSAPFFFDLLTKTMRSAWADPLRLRKAEQLA